MYSCILSHPSIFEMSLLLASANSPRNPSYHIVAFASLDFGRFPVPMLMNTPISRPGHSLTASSNASGAGLKVPTPSSWNTDWPIRMGLKARPMAHVALPASHILQSNSGGGSALES